MTSQGLRGRVTLAAAAVLLISIGTIIALGNVLLSRGLHRDAEVVLTARADSVRTSVEVVDGRVTVEDRPNADSRLGGRAWVYASGREIAGPTNAGDAGAAAAALRSATSIVTAERRDAELLLRAEPVLDASGSRQVATIVVALSSRPYRYTERRTLIGSLIVGLLVLVIGSAVAWRAVGAALGPVAAMARDAGAWSEHDLDRRFDRGPARDELGSLATTLDGLLGRIAASRRQEHRFSAEMAHELRTPLAAMRGEAELLQRRADDPAAVQAGLGAVVRHADRMARVIDTLLGVARNEVAPATGTGDADQAARSAAESAAAAASERGVSVSVAASPELPPVGSPADVVERALQPLVDNAVRHARTRVDITVAAHGTEVWFTVQDDGEGVDPELRASVFDPGVRSEGSGGVGLGLALSRRLALSCEGDVQLLPSRGGARFVLRLPAVS